ncbi:MAG: exopolyphosphatase, partial [Myxococcota bacterium]
MARAFAAVDVGSNAIRLSMVRLCPSGTLLDTQSHRYALRLGAEVYRLGYVRETLARGFVDVFRDVALRMRNFGVDERRAVATASLRDAANRDLLTTRVYDAHGIHIDVITGEEESNLSRAALVRALGFLDAESLLVDLGGGSLELMRVDGERAASLPLGTVRLLERYPRLRGRCS